MIETSWQGSCSRAPGGCASGPSTIVTSILSLNTPRRSFEDYVKHLGFLLARLPDTPVVAFVQRGYEERVARAHPHGSRTLAVFSIHSLNHMLIFSAVIVKNTRFCLLSCEIS